MKKTSIFSLIAITLLFALPSCKPTEDPLDHLTDGVLVTTADPIFVTGNTATCGVEATADNAGLLIEIGVCWGLSENPTVDDKVMASYKCSRPLLCLLTDLEYNTEYHVRSYAKYGTEYCYGEEKTFTTLDSLAPAPSPVTTLPAYDITSNGFSSNVVIEPFGVNYWHAGVCYSQNPDLTCYNCEGFNVTDASGSGGCHTYCSSLLPNTKYYYRAFVEYNNGIFYGEILSLITPDIPLELEISTEAYYETWYHDITAFGYLTCNKPEVVNQIGFCYSTTNPYPELESDSLIYSDTPVSTWQCFQGHISASNGGITLNTTYFIRAYAIYLNDSIKYGNVESINTYK